MCVLVIMIVLVHARRKSVPQAVGVIVAGGKAGQSLLDGHAWTGGVDDGCGGASCQLLLLKVVVKVVMVGHLGWGIVLFVCFLPLGDMSYYAAVLIYHNL